MKKSFLFLAVLFFAAAAMLSACGGDGGGSSTGAGITGAGATDGILVQDSQTVSTMASVAPLSDKITPSLVPSALASALRSPDRSTAGGTLAGQPFTVNYTVKYYDIAGQEITSMRNIRDVKKYVIVYNGTWTQEVTFTGTTEVGNITVKSFTLGDSAEFSGTSSGTAQFAYKNYMLYETSTDQFTVTINYKTSPATFTYSSQSGTKTLTGSDGWGLYLSYGPTGFTGTVKYNGVDEGTVTQSNGSLVITDGENNKSITINY